MKVGMQGFFVQRRLKRPVQPLAEQIGHAEHHFIDLPGRDHHIAQKAVRHLLQQPSGRFGMVAGIHVVLLHQPGHGIPGNGGGVHHHGHAHGNDPHAQRFLRQAQPVIAHAAAGFNAGVGDLDGAADAPAVESGQRVNGDDRRRAYPLDQPPAQLRRFDAGQPQHAGRNGADTPQTAPHFPGKAFPQMAGHQRPLHHPGAQRVGGHVAVAQPHHQHLALLGQQRPHGLCDQADEHWPLRLTASGQFRAFQRDVFAHGPLQHLRRPAGLDHDPRPFDAADLVGAHADALQPSALLPHAFHGQIRAKTAHTIPSFLWGQCARFDEKACGRFSLSFSFVLF